MPRERLDRGPVPRVAFNSLAGICDIINMLRIIDEELPLSIPLRVFGHRPASVARLPRDDLSIPLRVFAEPRPHLHLATDKGLSIPLRVFGERLVDLVRDEDGVLSIPLRVFDMRYRGL